MIAGLALAWLAILAGGWLGWQLLHQNGRLLVRLDELEKRLDEFEFGEDEQPAGLPLGSDAPQFELPDLAGQRTSLAQFRGQPLLLVFFNPGCGFCRDLAPKLAQFSPSPSLEQKDGERRLLDTLTMLVVTTGEAEANRQLFNEHKLNCAVLLQKEMDVAAAYKANGTPSGYLVSSDGKIASGLAIGAEAVLEIAKEPRGSQDRDAPTSPAQRSSSNGDGEDESFVTWAATTRFGNRSLARSKIKRDGLKAGTPAPDFRLPRLDGRGELSLSELRGRRVLLVFSSPSCGPCAVLAPRLEQFHRAHPEIELIMISKGEPKENRAKVKEHGLTFPIVLQQQWEISRRYAMFPTPVAYLIDEGGIIANDAVAGTEAILQLASNAPSLARA